jgi:hypothetical protein
LRHERLIDRQRDPVEQDQPGKQERQPGGSQDARLRIAGSERDDGGPDGPDDAEDAGQRQPLVAKSVRERRTAGQR